MLRIIALLATHNERRFIEASLEHNIAQGLDVYLIDNDSTDETVKLAERFLGQGLIGIEGFPRDGRTRWHALMTRKEELASTLDANWFIHLDADEFHFSANHQTLAQGVSEADAAGYNAINFLEFTFIPTIEEPDHDHEAFQHTLRSYYPFLPAFPHQMKAWKRQRNGIDLASSAGHLVQFPGLRMAPDSFFMRHYQFLSVSHAIEKYANRNYDPRDLARGWHGWRSTFDEKRVKLPLRSELRDYASDHHLDPSNPRKTHIAAAWSEE